MPGCLYIVSTPIGNLGDITLRAIETLKSVDFVAVEDTRIARKLFARFGISTKMHILNKDNEVASSQGIISSLVAGESVALISDAGTPLIHDPGHMLVADARSSGIQVVPIPGPCALIAALSVSGLEANNFMYCGFLNAKKSVLVKELELLQDEVKTLVFYEAPHRLLKTLLAMSEVFGGDRIVVLARELTKIHEEVVSTTLHELVKRVESGIVVVKGEMVIMVHGAKKIKVNICSEQLVSVEKFLACSLAKLSVKDAAKLAVDVLGIPHNQAYEKCLKIKDDGL